MAEDFKSKIITVLISSDPECKKKCSWIFYILDGYTISRKEMHGDRGT